MAFLDLADVTKVIVTFLKSTLPNSPAWPQLTDANFVSPLPPDKLPGGKLGVYLYHVTEDAQYKNAPSLGPGNPPIRYAPMGLNLYYQLYASPQDDQTGDQEKLYYNAQSLLGLAVKALHDCPVITPDTEVETPDGKTHNVFDDAQLDKGEGNTLRLTLQPVPYNEAVSYWSAGSMAPRLSAYYQVSVVVLEPETPKERVPRVLAYGVYPFAGEAPYLDGSENSLDVTIPDFGQTLQIQLRPAQVPIGGPISFTGKNLAGAETQLLLQSPYRKTLCRADGSAWQLKAGANRLAATVGLTILDTALDETDPAATVHVLPGIYAAQVRVIQQRPAPDGTLRRFEHTSNPTPFTITPRIDAVTGPGGDGTVTVNGYPFNSPGEIDPAADVQVYIGAKRLAYSDPNAAPDADHFQVLPDVPNDPLQAYQLKLMLPLPVLAPLPLRVVVNGVEAPPRWIPAS